MSISSGEGASQGETRAAYETAHGSNAEVARYLHWLYGRQAQGLSASDDVALRDYLLEERTHGAGRAGLRRTLRALKDLYAWALRAGRIAANPFDEYNFDRPWLSRDEIRRREQALGSPQERELVRLRALNQLAEALHRSLDVRTTLEAALTALGEVMGLKAAWAFLRADAGLLPAAGAPHDYLLAAARGLPPALEADQRHYLRKPPDCHCQSLLRAGRLPRAVNVVECTRLQEATGDKGGLLFHATVPLTIQGQPVGVMNFATEEWQFLTGADLQVLSTVSAHVSLALERARLYELAQSQNERLAHELAMAREVQASLLPASLPRIPGFELAAEWRAATEMAGDFYDVMPLADGHWGLAIADVADKGAPAALYMAVVSSRLHAAAERTLSPAAALAEVNRGLLRQAASGMFVTLFYAVLNPATRTLTCCNAGHNPPLLRRAGGQVEALPRGGTALGAIDNPHLQDRTLAMAPGEALVTYTDGVTEALSPTGEEYGTERLTSSIRTAPAQADSLLRAVCQDLERFVGDAPQPDDVTLMVLGCRA